MRSKGEEPGRCIGRAVGEFVQCLPVLLTIFCMHSKQLTLKKQRQEIMAMSLLLLKDLAFLANALIKMVMSFARSLSS